MTVPTGEIRHRTLVGLIATVVAASACGTGGPDEARVAGSEIAVRRLLSVWETADTVVLLDLFSPTAVYDDFPNQATYQGIEEIVGYVTEVHSWASGVFMNVTRVHAGENGAVAEWVFSAVQDRPMGDRVPVSTGLEVVLNGVTIIELERGRIVRAADYIDTAPLFLQLGGRIELPGGRTLTLENSR